MRGHIERRFSSITGRVTYRPRVFVGKREAANGVSAGWHNSTTYSRLRPHGDEPCAETALEQLKEQLQRKLSGEKPKADPETVAELLAHWTRDFVDMDDRDNTIRSHEFAVRLHIVPALGEVMAVDLSPAQVATWQAEQIAAGCAPKSVRNYRGTLHACYEWALALGIVERNPVAAVKPPRLAERSTVAPSMLAAGSYLAALRDTRLWPALMLAAFSGARRGEVLAVRWCDLDLAAGQLRLARNSTGRNKATHKVGPMKTKKSVRTIPLPQVALTELTRLKAERRIAAGPSWSEEALVCAGRRGQAIVPDRFTSELRRRLLTRELPPLHLHQLRHMVATEMLRAGERMDVVAQHLGHANVATTLGIYGHVSEEDAKAAADHVQRAWEKAVLKAAEKNRAQLAPDGAPVGDLAQQRARKRRGSVG